MSRVKFECKICGDTDKRAFRWASIAAMGRQKSVEGGCNRTCGHLVCQKCDFLACCDESFDEGYMPVPANYRTDKVHGRWENGCPICSSDGKACVGTPDAFENLNRHIFWHAEGGKSPDQVFECAGCGEPMHTGLSVEIHFQDVEEKGEGLAQHLLRGAMALTMGDRVRFGVTR